MFLQWHIARRGHRFSWSSGTAHGCAQAHTRRTGHRRQHARQLPLVAVSRATCLVTNLTPQWQLLALLLRRLPPCCRRVSCMTQPAHTPTRCTSPSTPSRTPAGSWDPGGKEVRAVAATLLVRLLPWHDHMQSCFITVSLQDQRPHKGRTSHFKHAGPTCLFPVWPVPLCRHQLRLGVLQAAADSPGNASPAVHVWPGAHTGGSRHAVLAQYLCHTLQPVSWDHRTPVLGLPFGLIQRTACKPNPCSLSLFPALFPAFCSLR